MSGPISKKYMIDTCIKGADDAASLYDEMSGGIPLNEVPESLLQAEIARKLSEQCHYVTVESSARWLLSAAGAETRGRLTRNNGGRIDVIVWSASDKPRYLIEVKRAWDSWALCADAKRLQSMLKRGGSLHRGLLVATVSAAKHPTIERRISELGENSGANLLKQSKIRLIDEDDPMSWLWCAAVYEVVT